MKHVDDPFQTNSLVLHRSSCSRRLFYQRCILLGNTVNLADRLVDLSDATFLFRGGNTNFLHDGADALHACDDVIHGATGIADQHAASLHGAGRGTDQILDFLGSRV